MFNLLLSLWFNMGVLEFVFGIGSGDCVSLLAYKDSMQPELGQPFFEKAYRLDPGLRK